MVQKPIEKHFDFRLNGSLDTDSNSDWRHSNDSAYGYALFVMNLKHKIIAILIF